MKRPIPFSAEQLSEMCTAYENGQGMAEIGEKFGLSREAVQKRLIENGVQIRHRGRPKNGGVKHAI